MLSAIISKLSKTRDQFQISGRQIPAPALVTHYSLSYEFP
jgi:hypothetical protein